MHCKKNTGNMLSVRHGPHWSRFSKSHLQPACERSSGTCGRDVANALDAHMTMGISSRLLMATALHKGLKMTCQSSANTAKLDCSAWFEMSSLAWDAHGNMFSRDCLLSGLQWLIFQFFKQDKSHFCPINIMLTANKHWSDVAWGFAESTHDEDALMFMQRRAIKLVTQLGPHLCHTNALILLNDNATYDRELKC